MERILVSACLIGWPVRFDGGARTLTDDRLAGWADEGRLVPLCPEIAAGLATPRPAVELRSGTTAAEILSGDGEARDADGGDWTNALREGARIALATARVRGCRFALLTEGSPSCGVTLVADGTFSGTKTPGRGVVAEALHAAGIEVFADVASLAARLAETE